MEVKHIFFNIFKNRFFRNLLLFVTFFILVTPFYLFENISKKFSDEIFYNIKDDAKNVAKHIHSRHFDLETILLLNNDMGKIIEDFNVYKVRFFDKDGVIVISSQEEEIGQKNKHDYFYDIVAKGEIFHTLVKKDGISNEGIKMKKDIVEIYIPFMNGTEFLGSFELYYDVTDKMLNFNKLKNRLKISQTIIILLLYIAFLIILYYASKNDLKRNLIEQELIKEKQKAEDASSYKSEFLANMSHELRTPLNSIIGFSEILLDEEQNSEKANKLKIINSSSKTLLQLINDILDFTKIETGKVEVELIPVEIVNEIKEICEIFTFQINGKNIKFYLGIDENLPNRIILDPLKLKQIILNLLSNAIKFTSSGKNIIVNVIYDKKNSKIVIEVIDEGIGIHKDKQNLVFEKFSQEDNSTTRKFGGTGLGLTISKNLANLMGGDITLESEVGVGSKFKLILPIKISNDKIIKNKNIKEHDFRNHKVLLVEDNKLNQLLFIEIMKKYNINIEIANDGIEALEIYKNNRYDIIFMDDKMPNMDGITTINEIKRLDKEHPAIIAFTANALATDREKFLNAGAVDFLTKPIDIQKLDKILVKILTKL